MLSASLILSADSGAGVPVADLAVNGKHLHVWALDSRRQLRAAHLTTVRAAGTAEAFTVRLASGRTVDAAGGTSLLTFAGWKRLDELALEDRIAVPRREPEPYATQRMMEDELILLAHMIGDGSCIKRQPVRYASVDEQNLRAVAAAAAHFGVTAVRDEYEAARVTTLRLPAPFRLTHGKRNPIAAWLDGLGLFDKRSYEKFVPAVVFASPNDQVALFLKHLWSTDGCVTWDAKAGQGRIYYASTSRPLIEDVRHLLLRLGIASRAYRVPQGRYRDIWHLHVSGVSSQRRFLRQVDAHGAKYFAAREVQHNLEGVVANENVDTVPREVWDKVRQTLMDHRMTHRAFAEAMRTKFCGSTMWKHAPSRSRLHRAAAVLHDRGLHDLTKNDLLWDKVVEIAAIGQREVYEVTVTGADNVIANGIAVRAIDGSNAA